MDNGFGPILSDQERLCIRHFLAVKKVYLECIFRSGLVPINYHNLFLSYSLILIFSSKKSKNIYSDQKNKKNPKNNNNEKRMPKRPEND
jgi:hypothetical protein